MLEKPVECLKESLDINWTDAPAAIQLVHRVGDDPVPTRIWLSLDDADRIADRIKELTAFVRQRSA